MTIKSVAAFLVAVHPLIAVAQTVTVNEIADSQSDYLHEFFRPVPERYIDVHYASPHGAFSYNRNEKRTEIIGYDAKLNEVYSKPVKALSGNKYQGAIELDKKLHFFYSNNKKVFRCELDPNTGEGIGTPSELFTATQAPVSLTKGFSPDSAYFYTVFKCGAFREKDELFDGVILDRKWNVVNKFSFRLEKVKNYIDRTTCVLTNEGLLFVINSVRVQPTKEEYKPLQFLVTEISKEGKNVTTHLGQLPDGRLSNMVWQPAKNGLSFTGLLSPVKKEGFKNIISGEFNSWQKKLTGLKQVAFRDSPYWQHAWENVSGIKTAGINEKSTLLHSFEEEDGSIMMVLQPTDIVTTFRGNSTYNDSYTYSLYVVKITPARELAWVQMVPLSQYEPFTPIYSGAVTLHHYKKELYLFFHDNQKNAKRASEELAKTTLSDSWDNDNQLAVVTIKADGSLGRIAVKHNTDPDHHLAPREPFAIYGNEIIYTSYNRRNAGRSTYKLGRIRIK